MFGLSLFEIIFTGALIAVVWLFYKRIGGMRGWRGWLRPSGAGRVRRPQGAGRMRGPRAGADHNGGYERRRGEETSSTDDDVIDMVKTPGSETYEPMRKRRRRSDRRG
jgi:hypothetical protein